MSHRGSRFGVEVDGNTDEDATRRVREKLEPGWLVGRWRVVHPDAPSPTTS